MAYASSPTAPVRAVRAEITELAEALLTSVDVLMSDEGRRRLRPYRQAVNARTVRALALVEDALGELGDPSAGLRCYACGATAETAALDGWAVGVAPEDYRSLGVACPDCCEGEQAPRREWRALLPRSVRRTRGTR